jgi:hypothetical protein
MQRRLETFQSASLQIDRAAASPPQTGAQIWWRLAGGHTEARGGAEGGVKAQWLRQHWAFCCVGSKECHGINEICNQIVFEGQAARL